MSRAEMVERTLDDEAYFVATRSSSRIRSLQLAQIYPGIEHQRVEIGAIDPDTGHVNHVDMLYVCAVARHVGARRIFEFGTYLGRTTYHLALGEGKPEVFTLDLPPQGEKPTDYKLGTAVTAVHSLKLQGVFFRGKPEASRITQLHGDCRTFDYAPYLGSMDLVFVDGGHTYDLIASDSEWAFKLIRPGGVIIWHDYAAKSRDVVRFGQELSMRKPLFWVTNTSLLVYINGVDAMTFEAIVPEWARERIKPR